MLKYLASAIGFASGFSPNVPVPIDVRLVVDTIADRNAIEFVYPSMPVTVLGAPVMAGSVATFPNQTHWRCLVQKNPNFSGPTTTDPDWKAETSVSNGSGNYKGVYNVAMNGPNLSPDEPNGVAYRASLVAGDYFIVSIPGTPAFDGLPACDLRDTLFWNGNKFDRFANTNPVVDPPLYKQDEGVRFTTDVLGLIRLNALREWQSATDYGINSYVKHSYAQNGKDYVDTYTAIARMTAATAALPTEFAPNENWQLITTTNGARLGGTASGNDAVGRAASGAFMPIARTANTYLSPEEIDARIKQYGGASGGAVLGGNAATFLTEDVAEGPRN